MTHHQFGVALSLLLEGRVGSEPAGGGRESPLGKGSSSDHGCHGYGVRSLSRYLDVGWVVVGVGKMEVIAGLRIILIERGGTMP